eukprot:1473294-Prymnesium_polylepis.1
MLRLGMSQLSATTALVVVVPTGSTCDAKLLRWRRWASEAAALHIAFHILADGPLSHLAPRFYEILGGDVQLHQMANESSIMHRYPGMKWGESQASGTPGTEGAMRLRELPSSPHTDTQSSPHPAAHTRPQALHTPTHTVTAPAAHTRPVQPALKCVRARARRVVRSLSILLGMVGSGREEECARLRLCLVR